MKTYLVGGAVRDMLLGVEPKDKDYVVVGSTPEEMIQKGFIQVGKSFPVFLHPTTGDEYALARKERKTGPGYNGFSVDFDASVSLEDDLSRRDLSMNAIAYDLETKTFIDPYGGISDIENKVIRHVGEAFSEDPLRVLRVARFLSRYGFKIDTETITLCEKVTKSPDFDLLTPERIWVEIEKIFKEPLTSNGLRFLIKVGGDHSERLGPFLCDEQTLDACVSKITRIYGSETNLDHIEKLLMFTTIYQWTRDVVSKYKVPTDVKESIDFLFKTWGLYEDIADQVPERHETFLNVFDRFREKIRNGKFADYRKLVEKQTPITIDIQKILDSIEKTFQELLALDFTEEVKGMNGMQIKKYVRRVKLEIIQKHV